NINAIFVVGGSEESGGGFSDYGAIKVDTSGNYAWEHFYDGVGNLHDAAVSGTTMIFNQYLGVIGASNQSSGIWAIVLDMVKVSDGTTYITSTLDTTAVTMVEATAMVTDDQNRMFITGYSLDGT